MAAQTSTSKLVTGTEFLDAETRRLKSPLRHLDTGRDQNPRNERPEIPAENALFNVVLETRGLQGLGGGRTRARTWDPMIKSQLSRFADLLVLASLFGLALF
jgi:hypothetical protein